MSKTEIRVRPVVRHIVTRHTEWGDTGRKTEPVGEFDNEQYAEEIAEALRKAHKAKQYAIVERSFEFGAMVAYADHIEVAEAMQRDLQAEHGREFRIYEREVTDPMAIARIQLQNGAQELVGYLSAKKCVGAGQQSARD